MNEPAFVFTTSAPRVSQERSQAVAGSSDAGEGKRKRPRPAFSCLQCRQKKLKCDRGHPCDRCTKRFKSDPSVAQECIYRQDGGPAGSDGAGEGDGSVVSVNLMEGELEIGGERERKREREKERDRSFNGVIRQDSERSRVKIQRIDSRDFAAVRQVPEVESPRIGIIEDLQARLEKVEKLLSAHKEAGHVLPSKPTANRSGMLRAKGGNSFYHPIGNKMSFIPHFRDSKMFCRKHLDKRDLPDSMKEIHAFEKRLSKKHKYRKYPERKMDNDEILLKFLDSFSSREICDRLARRYFSSFENIYRILHEPSFWTECAEFWACKEEERPDKFSWFIPQYALVMAISAPLEGLDIHPENSSDGRFPLSAVFDYAETWLDQLSGKRRSNTAALQTKCLLILAQQSSGIPGERIWAFTGTLVRYAISMGLHIDPSDFSQITVFQGEMRRRLWATIVELDFQTSLICGYPCAVREDEFKCLPPSNLDDLDLTIDMEELPNEAPGHQWSDSLCQSTLASSLPQRMKAMALIWNQRAEPDYDEVLGEGAKLGDLLRQLPRDLKIDENPQALIDQPRNFFGKILLDTLIRRSIAGLYRPFALHIQGAEVFPEARRGCVQAGLAVLSHQDRLLEAHMGAYEDIYFKMCRQDIVQAGLTIGLEVKDIKRYAVAQLLPSPDTASNQADYHHQLYPPMPGPPRPIYTSMYSQDYLLSVMEKALQCQLRRIGDFNSNVKDSVILTVALQSLKMGPEAEHKRILGMAAEMVLEVCRKRYPIPEHSPTTTSESVGTGVAETTPVNVPEFAKGGGMLGPMDQNGLVPFDNFDFTNFDFNSAEMDILFPMEWDWSQSWS